jgi:hypothetical protein
MGFHQERGVLGGIAPGSLRPGRDGIPAIPVSLFTLHMASQGIIGSRESGRRSGVPLIGNPFSSRAY